MTAPNAPSVGQVVDQAVCRYCDRAIRCTFWGKAGFIWTHDNTTVAACRPVIKATPPIDHEMPPLLIPPAVTS